MFFDGIYWDGGWGGGWVDLWGRFRTRRARRVGCRKPLMRGFTYWYGLLSGAFWVFLLFYFCDSSYSFFSFSMYESSDIAFIISSLLFCLLSHVKMSFMFFSPFARPSKRPSVKPSLIPFSIPSAKPSSCRPLRKRPYYSPGKCGLPALP